jgi:DNA-binding transcriptional MerR regulator
MATITINEAFFREPRFRPPQVLRICRVERDNLLDWHRRDLLPDARTAKGRGHRRLYSVRDAIYINTVRILAEADAPLDEAALLAADMVDAAAGLFPRQVAAVHMGRHTDQMADCFVVLYRFDGQWRNQWFGINGCDPIPSGGLQGWMRSLNLESAVVLDINSITTMLFNRILEELEVSAD